MSRIKSKISTYAFRFLRLFCPPQLLEEIEGDLMQRYERDVKEVGDRRANRRLVWNTVRYFRPGILLRNRPVYNENQIAMVGSYLKTSLRHIRKSKVNSAFKVGGLSLAIFSFLAIAIYVSFQLSFDTFHTDYQKVYRINSQRKENGVLEKYAVVPLGLGPILQQQVSEIVSTTRIRYTDHTYLRYDNELFESEGMIEADSTIFNVLTFKFIKGDKSALQKPTGIVLTRTIAKKIFGTTDVLQQTLGTNNDTNLYEVTAVIEDTPPNSHIFLTAIIPFREKHDLSLISIADPVVFVDYAATTFARLSKPTDPNFMEKVNSVIEPYIRKSDRTQHGFDIFFQPIADVYLGPAYKRDYFRKGSPVYLYSFSVLGILLLVVAGINYVNLSIADFNSRSRETGVRKVLGARKYQLVTQVTVDTIVFSTLALVVALGSLYLLFPKIMQVLDSSLQFSMLKNPGFLILVIPGLLSVLFFSTYFPARQFATTRAIHNLKAKNTGYNSSLSQLLLVTQFSISVVCICCTLIVGSQISFMHNKDLGFDKRNLLVLSLPWEFTVKNMQTFKQEIRQIAGVTNVSNSSFRLSGGYWKDWYFIEEEGTGAIKHVELYEVFSDDALFETLQIKILEGRAFDDNVPYDSGAAFVVNESLVREMGWIDPIGKRIYTHPEEKGKWDGTVVGVVSDINISPLYDRVKPLVMRLPWTNEYPDGFVYVRYDGDVQAVVNSIESKYDAIMPGYPFNYRFVDELYDSRYAKETKAFASLQFGTFVIVLVSVLGIFSMAAYVSIRRMKEFGIRKVLGATRSHIVTLHLGFFAKLMLASNLIALPLAYWLVREWLDIFAYRIDLTIFPFIAAGLASILMVVLSGSYQALKAGRMNPVDVIKME
jgi:putative ABC transport system permease protein